jgi:hypothetical protein
MELMGSRIIKEGSFHEYQFRSRGDVDFGYHDKKPNISR